MASTFGYATKNDLQNLLGINIDSSFNTQIDTWISAAERRVNQYTGYTTASGMLMEAITGEVAEARVDGDLNLVVFPRKNPISSVSQIQIVKGSYAITLSLTNSSGTNRYALPDPKNVIVYPNYEVTQTATSALFIRNFVDIKFSRFFTNINYIAGYNPLTEDVQLATTLLAADIVMRQSNKEGLVSMTQGRLSKRWGERKDGRSDFEIQAFDILTNYKLSSGWL